ncbi:23S rRNA (adenine(2503)-C(2))-methyltransferase RlmN [Candidatus Falkowbacteria bacterium CG10_big_fil_rev_8_21_14_0_10_37_14]|uniref:Probable dual-specificity RNA methyltransferase RlmN n=1 Tax=Candidatus Falkowbacteria bacterium CG10_big_fil_rev_8_21_14_0_10_37_14 TaxID=1974561 RepID=A0A2M6WT50_9BACT|nr:23S rRNA (adenine(2503)-C(2))-methyltransferase RlmN [Candidatus Falkowbacteria bacterium]PIT95896.1 MAG: 23S rRNA (adenine(2503)-C(2))-methyltransferase RlmN [Candidatus Falkowbacteria bacterium CG10_big_fil_rev_8_21_14_0_10_37_14]
MNWLFQANWLADEKPYRRQQVIEGVFKNLITDWGQATNLPLALRQYLELECSLEIDAITSISKDKTSEKALIKYADGLCAETVLMRHKTGRLTVCVSSQIGCPLGCSFCATGKLGLQRNLTAGEILMQVLYWARLVKQEDDRLNNLVFMGMGEPLLNYDEVWSAIRWINSDEGLGIGARHISISTAGIVPGIRRLAAENYQVNLAISLHASNNRLRTKLMPINKRYNIEQVLIAVDNYIVKTGRQVMFEYLLLSGINDSPNHARELAKLLNKSLYIVNLLPYNPTGVYRASKKEEQNEFRRILSEAGIKVTVRNSLGGDIDAACGQLATQTTNSLPIR